MIAGDDADDDEDRSLVLLMLELMPSSLCLQSKREGIASKATSSRAEREDEDGKMLLVVVLAVLPAAGF